MSSVKYAIGPSTSLSEFSYGPFLNLEGVLALVPYDKIVETGKPIFVYELTPGHKDRKRLYRWHSKKGWVKL